MRYLLIVVLFVVFQITSHAAERPPNFVVVLADDIGAKELACYGNTQHETPRLDQLAQQGMRFETCWATPLCTPTRVMLMTGQYAFHTGYFHMYGRAYSPERNSPEHEIGGKLTFADVLKAKGYATGMAGKWQLSGEHPNLIHDCGFDEYRMWAYAENLPRGVDHTGRFEGPNKPARYWHPSIVENGKYLPTKPDDYGPDLFNAFAIDFITRHKDEPFFFYYTMPLTHGPHEETPDPAQPDGSPRKRRPAGYKSNIEYLDHLMGQLVDSIDRLGLGENTYFIFIGDNGTGGQGKGTLTELGVRVPLIVRCPGSVKSGVVSRELVSASDIFPTLVELAAAKLPDGHKLDGKSLAPTLRGENTKHRELLFSYLGPGRIIRDERFILEVPGEGRPPKLIDGGQARNGSGYHDVTDSPDSEATAARQRLELALKDLPGPEGHAGLKQPVAGEGAGKAKAKAKAKRKAKRTAKAAAVD